MALVWHIDLACVGCIGRVGAAQLRDSPENCVRVAFAKSGMKREMGHQMGRHIIHTVAATEVDTRQRIHNLAL